MLTSDFDYVLPPELIAQMPVEPRDSSRLLVLHRSSGQLDHRRFTDILEYLRPGDVMVFNQSRVIAARLLGRRDDTGSKVEFLLLRREAPNIWRALSKPARRLRPGVTVSVAASGLPNHTQAPLTKGRSASGTAAEVPALIGGGMLRFPESQLSVEVLDSHEDGIKTLRLSSDDEISNFGHTPLPPYIRQRLANSERYQTVYATQLGSVAAPTAGLHFTESLLQQIRDSGVETVFVTLHVGLDTFRPVKTENPRLHQIHREQFEIDGTTAAALNRAQEERRRIIAVGTTSVRVLEQAAQDIHQDGSMKFSAVRGEAEIYILPSHRFRAVDSMITNFHLPRSTLLMLVSAFAERQGYQASNPPSDSGRTVVLNAYREAVKQRYRFYSFGDAMFIQ